MSDVAELIEMHFEADNIWKKIRILGKIRIILEENPSYPHAAEIIDIAEKLIRALREWMNNPSPDIEEKIQHLEDRLKQYGNNFQNTGHQTTSIISTPSSILKIIKIINNITNEVIDDYKHKLGNFERFGLSKLDFWRYTLHDTGHADRVWEYAQEIIRELNIQLNPVEWSILKLAVYVHDISMAYGQTIFQNEYGNEEWTATEFRKRHGGISAAIWNQEFNAHYLRKFSSVLTNVSLPRFREAVAILAEYHNKQDAPEEKIMNIALKDGHDHTYKYTVDIYALLGILKLADKMDATDMRVLEQKDKFKLVLALAYCYDAEYKTQIMHDLKHLVTSNIKLRGNQILLTLRDLGEVTFFPNSKNEFKVTIGDIQKMIGKEFAKNGIGVPSGGFDNSPAPGTVPYLLNNSTKNLNVSLGLTIIRESVPFILYKEFPREEIYSAMRSYISGNPPEVVDRELFQRCTESPQGIEDIYIQKIINH